MSATNRPFVEQDGGYTRSGPGPLRPPSAANQAEALRRHLEGDSTPLRSDGDVGWTSFVGKRVTPRGISEGLPDNRNIDHPRDALRGALQARDELSSEMRRIGAELKQAESVATTVQIDLNELQAKDRLAWSAWADADRSSPAPVNSLQRRTELEAIHQSAERKVEGLRVTHQQAEAIYLDRVAEVKRAVSNALFATVLDEVAAELKERQYQLKVESAQIQARLLGLAGYFKANGNGHASDQILRQTSGIQRMSAMLPELRQMEAEASQFPMRLLQDSDAEL